MLEIEIPNDESYGNYIEFRYYATLVEICFTYTYGDPLENLMDRTASLLEGAEKGRLTFDSEPAIYPMNMERLDDTNLLIEIYWHPDEDDHPWEESERCVRLLRAVCPLIDFAERVYGQMCERFESMPRISQECRFDTDYFPYGSFKALEKSLARAKALRSEFLR